MTKFIFVTGGVVSSLGKGIAAASIANLLEAHGLRVTMQKLDPYINVDPGTMSPFQHGEVYVTDDGTETDLDLGHYERFTNATMTRDSNVTTGQVYQSVINKERHGDYLGGTVQVIPHITDEIKSRILRLADKDCYDVIITEIGGTVGDIESQPFLEAIRQLPYDIGHDNVLYVHLTLIPFIRAAGEMKTKPSQHSVRALREIGIQPHLLICRSELPLDEGNRAKIAMFCNIEPGCVFQAIDVPEIYEIPLRFAEQGVDDMIIRKLNLKHTPLNNKPWIEMVSRVKEVSEKLRIGVVGKYIDLQDAYKSIYEALRHGAISENIKLDIQRIDSETIMDSTVDEILGGLSGILIPGGFGTRGIEGKIRAAGYARRNKIPFFGICLGMQCAVIEFARNVAGMQDANSSEFNADTPFPVIDLLATQKSITSLGGTMRLGAYSCRLKAESKTREAYGVDQVSERHRHRYEFNNKYRDTLSEYGMMLAGTTLDNRLVEIVEIPEHPWFVACQFHPEFKSRPLTPHPLFHQFIAAAKKVTAGKMEGKVKK